MVRWKIINALLVLIVALLGFEIVRTWGRALPPVRVPAAAPVPEPRDVEKGKRRGGEKAAARAQQTPEALVEAIAEKDLFDPSRRPPAPEEVKVEPPPPPVVKPPAGVTIVGVQILGKEREVYVNDASHQPAGGKRLRVGDEIAGYTIKRIDPAGVMLSSPSGDPVTMPLVVNKAKGAAPQQPQAPGRPPQPGAPAPPGMAPPGASPAAGVVPNAPPPPRPPAAPAVGQPAVQPNPQRQKLPPSVQQRLQRLQQFRQRANE